MYGGDEQLVGERRLGTLGDARSFGITTSVAPRFIVLYSPDFERKPASFAYYVVRNTTGGWVVEEHPVSTTEELPVDPRESGCGSS